MSAETTGSGVDTVAVIGAGSIGIAWTIVFAGAGLHVRLYEQDATLREAALSEVALKLGDL
jgi:L-gulonate 3-dehydrogenase